MRWYKLAAVAIVFAAVSTAAWVLAHRGERSAVIVEEWPEMQGQTWNKPNLVEAKMIVPDRPHDPEEARLHREGKAHIGRVRRFTVSTNADRLRMPPLAPKKPGYTRIAAVGDSVTFGWGLPPAETWVHLLEEELLARGKKVEVINAGLPGAQLPSLTAWCETQAPRLDVDRVIFTRRPPPPQAGGSRGLAEAIRTCARRTRGPTFAFLSPLSRFDLHGNAVAAQEYAEVATALGPDIPLLDLTADMRAAQGNRGEDLAFRDGELSVVDLESGKVWLTTPGTADGPLPVEIGALFEAEPEVAEALMYDGGHPDAEGSRVVAKVIADRIAPSL